MLVDPHTFGNLIIIPETDFEAKYLRWNFNKKLVAEFGDYSGSHLGNRAIFVRPISETTVRHKTVRTKHLTKQHKVDICPTCNGTGVRYRGYPNRRYKCNICGGSGKRSIVA